MVAGALDPLEGSVVILGGSALAAAGAFFARTRRYWLQLTAFVLVALGVAALFGLSASVVLAETPAGPCGGWRSACPIPSGG